MTENNTIEKINTYTMIDVTGQVVQVSETKKNNYKKLGVIDSNETYYSVYIPIALEISKYTRIRVSGNYQANVAEDKTFHNIFLNAHRKGHSLHVITESENILETI